MLDPLIQFDLVPVKGVPRTKIVPAVRTREHPGTSANSSRNYEKIPPVRKGLLDSFLNESAVRTNQLNE